MLLLIILISFFSIFQSGDLQASTSSASKRKIEQYKEVETTDIKRTIADIHMFGSLVSELACGNCNQKQLQLNCDETKRKGLVYLLEVFCVACDSVICSSYTSDKHEASSKFSVNVSAVVASLLTGLGPVKFRNFSEYLDIPSLHHKTFNQIAAENVFPNNGKIQDAVFERAAEKVKEEYQKQGLAQPDDSGVLDISVSFDGSWLTRGHTSLVGLGSVIDTVTGLVLDAHVMSKHCQVCATTGKWHEERNPSTFARWKEKHVADGCHANFSGTGMMEAEAAAVLWSRSVDRGFRYTSFVGDGDSKAYNKVVEMKPYGPNITIWKEECINHVGKRLGTALRNLASDCSKRGITLGGRGHGRLTAETIRKLSVYYSRAIRREKTAAEMKKAILASIYHGFSIDKLPQHQYCPPGPDSWCFWKASLARKVFPSGHKKRVHTPLDFDLLSPHILPVYERLTDDKLLQRCEKKATQNPNESLHNSIWSKCSKTDFHSRGRVEFSALTAIAEFNFGPAAAMEVKKILGLSSGQHASRLSSARAKKRIYKSDCVRQDAEKKRRKQRKTAQEKAAREAEEEDGVGNGAGQF